MQKADLEQLVNNLMVSSDQNSSTQSQTTQEQPISNFTDHERDVTGYLFAKLFALYANAFYLVYPSKKEVNFAKNQYAKEIGRYTREQIDEAMKQLARLAISPERENRIYREPNVPATLAMMEEAVKRNRAHNLFLPVPPEPKEYKSRRYEEGLKQTAALLAMLDDKPEEKPLTPAEIADNERLEKLKNA